MKMAPDRAGRITFAVTFPGVMVVFTHDQVLLFGADNANTVAAGFLVRRLRVGAVNSLMGRLLPRLGNVGRSLGQIFSVLLLFVNDLFVVRYISWIGHDSR